MYGEYSEHLYRFGISDSNQLFERHINCDWSQSFVDNSPKVCVEGGIAINRSSSVLFTFKPLRFLICMSGAIKFVRKMATAELACKFSTYSSNPIDNAIV